MIRRAKLEDMEKINQLLEQVLTVHHIGRPDLFKGGVKKYNNQELKELIRDENSPIFVIVDDSDCVLGYAFCKIQCNENHNILTDIKTLYIDDLCIDEKFRGRNLGKTLYEGVKEYASDIGCYNVTLNVWSCNKSAISFYEKCGLAIQKIGMEEIL